MDFLAETKKLNLILTSNQIKQFSLYYESLIRVNSYMNLTAITEKEAIYRKHFLDSLELFRILPSQPYSLCDVGSGAGFPGIPIAIADINAKVTIIDALNKRIQFLDDLIHDLALTNVIAMHKRAEDYAKEVGASFDIVTARAVAKLNILAELCLPLVKLNGIFVAMKGSSGKEEALEAKHAVQILGGRIEKIIEFSLPDEQEKRQILVIRKIKATPSLYPRAYGKIKEKPL